MTELTFVATWIYLYTEARQVGNETEAVAYADKAKERFRRKYYKMLKYDKKKNVVVTAVAREIDCFI